MRASVEGLMVFFIFFEFGVARSKEFLHVCQAVVGPMSSVLEDECVKEISVLFVGSGTPTDTMGRRTTLPKKGKFDCTLGFPGEDLSSFPVQLSHSAN